MPLRVRGGRLPRHLPPSEASAAARESKIILRLVQPRIYYVRLYTSGHIRSEACVLNRTVYWRVAGVDHEERSIALRPKSPSASAIFALTDGVSRITASKLYMQRSTPLCRRKSAVPEAIFGSLESSSVATIDWAEVWALSRLCALSLLCEALVPAPRRRLPSRCNKRCRPREQPASWTRPQSSSRGGFDSRSESSARLVEGHRNHRAWPS